MSKENILTKIENKYLIIFFSLIVFQTDKLLKN